MMIDENASSLPDCPPLLTSLLGFDAPASWAQSVNVLVQLAASMRAHKRGGALLVVPSGSDAWRESIVQPVTYAIRPLFSELSELMQDPRTEKRLWQDALARAVEVVALRDLGPRAPRRSAAALTANVEPRTVTSPSSNLSAVHPATCRAARSSRGSRSRPSACCPSSLRARPATAWTRPSSASC